MLCVWFDISNRLYPLDSSPFSDLEYQGLNPVKGDGSLSHNGRQNSDLRFPLLKPVRLQKFSSPTSPFDTSEETLCDGELLGIFNYRMAAQVGMDAEGDTGMGNGVG